MATQMTPTGFDAQVSGRPDGERLPTTVDERNAVLELGALRELRYKVSEFACLEASIHLEKCARR